MNYLYTLNAVDLTFMPDNRDLVWITPQGTVVTHNEYLCDVNVPKELHEGTLELHVANSQYEGYHVAIRYGEGNNCLLTHTKGRYSDIIISDVYYILPYEEDRFAWITHTDKGVVLHIGLPGNSIHHYLGDVDKEFDSTLIVGYCEAEGRSILAYLTSYRRLYVKRTATGNIHTFDLEFDCYDVSINATTGDIILWDHDSNGTILKEGDEVPRFHPADFMMICSTAVFTEDNEHYFCDGISGRIYKSNDLTRTVTNSPRQYVVEEGFDNAQVGETCLVIESMSHCDAMTSFVESMKTFYIVSK